MDSIVGVVGVFVAATVAGALNSVAGGGSLISFPTLVAFGVPAIPANATNTASLWPGSLSSAVAYSRDTKLDLSIVAALLVPSMIGGLLGAEILVITPPDLFNHVVPFLVLFATMLFAARGLFDRLARREAGVRRVSAMGRVWGVLFQLFVATYGGYFGAGIGILMLGSLSIMGLRDIHEMNGLKTVLAAIINVIAFLFLASRGLVIWSLALLMAVGAIIGGFGGARLARRVDQALLQNFVVAVGVVVSVWLFARA